MPNKFAFANPEHSLMCHGHNGAPCLAFPRKAWLLFVAAIALSTCPHAQAAATDSALPGARREIYKSVDGVELGLHIFEPPDFDAGQQRPTAVFFFGGGWIGGTVKQFAPHCQYLASRGMVAIAAEYRVRSRHNTTPFECVEDGRSAIRWLRQHHVRLGIDPERIAAGGGSAGGHVAAATATIEGLDAPDEDANVSAKPNALLLFNPVYDNGPNGYGHDRVGDRYPDISPLHNIRQGAPPAIVFLGTRDALIPVETAQDFQRRMRDVGSRSDLHLYEGQRHGFFNSPHGAGSPSPGYYAKTVRAMDEFLASLGYVDGKPTIPPPHWELRAKQQHLDVLYADQIVARYMTDFDESSEERRHETYKPYLHVFDQRGRQPITKGPGGQYTHHRGIFVGYNQTRIGAKQYDLWHMKNTVQIHRRFSNMNATEDEAQFTSHVDWLDDQGQILLSEQRTTRFLPPPNTAYALIDLECQLTASAGAVTLAGDPEHAGAQFRPANEIVAEQTEYFFHHERIDPKQDRDLPWVGQSIQLPNGRFSVVMLNHPSNPRETIFSAYRDYGRFGAYPRLELDREESATLRYRWMVAAGKSIPADVITRAHADFAAR